MIIKQCLICNKDFKTRQSDVNRGNGKFCSQSCSAKNANKNKVKKKYYCNNCGDLVGVGYSNMKTVCANCNKCPKVDDSKITLKELKDKYNINQYHAKIRMRSRIAAKDLEKKCEVCGYDKHVEICHIKEVHEFDLDSTLAEVNALSNLKVLCPNHHWELDHCGQENQDIRHPHKVE